MPSLRFGRHAIRLPRTKILRVLLGIALIFGGILSFLPVLGLWMFPLGIMVLSVDFHAMRKARRRVLVWWTRRRKKKRPGD
jgi:purine-cytosine permease-like protein